MVKVFTMIALVFCVAMANAQENGLNPVYRVQFHDLEYKQPQKKTTAGAVLGVIVDVAAGKLNDTHHENYIPAVNAKVKGALSQVRRLVTVDGKGESSDAKFSGYITKLSTTTETRTREYKDDKGKVKKETTTHYDATVDVTLTITWASDGVTETHNFSAVGFSYYSLSSAEKALDMAISELGEKIAKFYNASFPIVGNIVERGNEKKDKQKEVYLDVGAMNHVTSDMHFRVYVIGNVAGRETRKEVGKLKVKEVLGDDICLCKVQSGGKDIKAALDEGKHVLAISKD